MPPLFSDHVISGSYWRSLRYFNLYRLVLASLLVLVGIRFGGLDSGFSVGDSRLFRIVSVIYLMACIVGTVWLLRLARRFNWHLSMVVVTDTVFLLSLMHVSGGLGSGLGVLLLVSLAAAGLVGQGRLVLSYAAFASLGLLSQQTYQGLSSEFEGAAFFRAGLFSLAFFATAISARLLARRVTASEDLAKRRGKDLNRQLKVTTRVISLLDDGVLVVSPGGQILQANPRARTFLTPGVPDSDGVNAAWPELAREYAAWQSGRVSTAVELRHGSAGTVLSVRFLPVDSSAGGDTLIYLQDVGQQREMAQQLKLAALGRLTANIAHEIRNPLSAIRHAAELLVEDERDKSGKRLLEIVLDNTQRLDGIVSDVLELGRRDRVIRKPVDLAEFLPGFIQQFEVAQQISPGIVVAEKPEGIIQFDTTHLHQVLWNLLTNAIRYASGQPGSIVIHVVQVATKRGISINVTDDGPGIPESQIAQLFEPFVTTHEQGSGLGLFVARELCEANSASLEYCSSPVGACFVVRGES